MTAEKLARRFHETYERLAPEYGYETRKGSAVPWENMPNENKALMISVCEELLQNLTINELPSLEQMAMRQGQIDDWYA